MMLDDCDGFTSFSDLKDSMFESLVCLPGKDSIFWDETSGPGSVRVSIRFLV